jgi:hypothetical protein
MLDAADAATPARSLARAAGMPCDDEEFLKVVGEFRSLRSPVDALARLEFPEPNIAPLSTSRPW